MSKELVDKIYEAVKFNPEYKLEMETIWRMAEILESFPVKDESLENFLELFVQNCQAVQHTMPGGTLRSRQILSFIYQLTGFADMSNGCTIIRRNK